MKVERVPIESLVGDPANVRKHDQKNLDAIKGSLARFGQQKPVVVGAHNVVIAGNGTVAAALSLGWKEIAIVRSELIGPDATAYAIADNRTAELATWDDDALAQQLAAIQINDEDLARATGFDAREIERLSKGGEVVEDEVPEPPADPITKTGDLWVLGEHRLLCGDSTKAEDVARLMAGAKAGMVWTDPPYGVNYVGGTKDPRRPTHRTGGIVHNDDATGEDLVRLVSSAVRGIPKMDSAVCYMASPAGCNVKEFIEAYNNSGFQFKHTLVWVKSAFVFGRADYHYKHELVLYGWAKTHAWNGPRDISTVFEFPRGDKNIEHPTSKPVGLVVGTMSNHSCDVVADPFLGSGTTLIAAEQLGRKCYGMEISPQYCDVIVKRWETLTQRKAVRYPAAS